MQRWIAISDTHGDMLDAEAWRFVREFIDDFRPDVRLHLGDAFDLRFLRSGASDEEKGEEVLADFEMGMTLLDEYRPTHFLWGNHDHRLVRACSNAGGLVRAFARHWHDLVVKQLQLLGCKQYAYNIRTGVAEVCGLRFAHGFAHGMYASKQHAIAYGDVLTGHVHRIDCITAPRTQSSGATVAKGRAIGCLCRLDMEYAQFKLATMMWQHGFAYGEHDPKTGRTTVCQAERCQVTGAWNLPTLLRSPDSPGPSKTTTARPLNRGKAAGGRSKK